MAEFDKKEDGNLSEKGEEQMKKLQFEYVSFVYKTMAELSTEDLASMIFDEKWFLNENLVSKVNAIYQKLISLDMPVDVSEYSRAFGMELIGRIWNAVESTVAQEKENLIRTSVGKKEYRDVTLKDIIEKIRENTEVKE